MNDGGGASGFPLLLYRYFLVWYRWEAGVYVLGADGAP